MKLILRFNFPYSLKEEIGKCLKNVPHHLLPMQPLYKRFHPNNVWYCCGSVDESFYFPFSFLQTMEAEDTTAA